MGESGDFSLLDFEACFRQHQNTDDGLVTKHEMITFIKKVVGLDDEQWLNNKNNIINNNRPPSC